MQRIAVFARNHSHFLESASKVSANDPSRLITFRSLVRWSSAQKAVNDQDVVRLYLAPIGSKGEVWYEATLDKIKLDPVDGDPETTKALSYELPETKSDGLWGSNESAVKTLYSISH